MTDAEKVAGRFFAVGTRVDILKRRGLL